MLEVLGFKVNSCNVNLLIVPGRFPIFFEGFSVYALFCDSLFMLRMNACTPSILARLLPVKMTALQFDKLRIESQMKTRCVLFGRYSRQLAFQKKVLVQCKQIINDHA